MISLRKLHTVTRTYRHFRRYQQILGILIKYGFGDILGQLRLYQFFEKGIGFFYKKTEVSHLTRYERIRLALEELGPTFIKLGQLLSTRPDLVPPSLAEELAKLQDKVPPFSFAEVKEIIESEFKKPLEVVFSFFEEKPIAAASLGQVHRARLKTGEEVAVKVQRPHIKRIIEIDLEIMLYLAKLLQRHIVEAEWYDPVSVVKEFAKSITKELDYTLEAANIERFAKNFIGDTTIYVPKVYRAYSTEKILTMEFIDGIKISEVEKLKASGYDCRLIARRGANLILKQVFEYNFFHGDPHPGNIFILPGNIICFLDYGMMGRIDSETKDTLAQLVRAFVDKDVEETTRWLLKLYPAENVNLKELKLDIWELLDQYHGVPLKQIRLKHLFRQVLSIVERHHLRIPPDLFLLNKALVALEGLGKSLDPEFDAITHIKPFIKKIVSQKYNPFLMARRWQRGLGELIFLLQELPQEIREIVRLFKRGEFKIRLEHKHLEDFIAKQDQVSNRLAFAIIVAALIVGSALIVLANTPPYFFGIPAIGLLGFSIAGIMGILLLIAIFRSGKF